MPSKPAAASLPPGSSLPADERQVADADMPSAACRLLPIALMGVLTACHTDPFGMKPEVPGVELPRSPAAEPEGQMPAPEPPP